jgi:hypothetical protein
MILPFIIYPPFELRTPPSRQGEILSVDIHMSRRALAHEIFNQLH